MTKKRKILPIILVICLVSLGIYFYLFSERDKEAKEVFIEDGEYSFRVSSAEGIYPKFKSGRWSKRPDFIIGGVDEELEAGIKVEDPAGISKVTLLVIGHKDNLRKEIELELSDGDPKLGMWSAKFEIPKEMKRIFWTNFYVENNKGKTDDLSLDWREGSTCPYGMTGNKTYSSCEISSDEEGGTVSGRITVTGTVNLHGTPGHPAYLIFTGGSGNGIVFSGGKIVLYGNTSSIIIKAGTKDSVHNKTAAICAYSAAGKTRCGGTYDSCTGVGDRTYSWVQACGSRANGCANCGGCNYWCVYADYGYPSGHDGASATGCGKPNCALNKCELLDSWRGCTGFCPEDSCYVSHDWGHSEYVYCCCYDDVPSYSCSPAFFCTTHADGTPCGPCSWCEGGNCLFCRWEDVGGIISRGSVPDWSDLGTCNLSNRGRTGANCGGKTCGANCAYVSKTVDGPYRRSECVCD